MFDRIKHHLQQGNGMDRLARANLIFVFAFLFFYLLSHNHFFLWSCIALTVVFFFRLFSHNHAMREQENRVFVMVAERLWGGLSHKLAQRRATRQLKQQYLLFQCPHCGQKLRLPRGKGAVEVTCHRCQTKFQQKS